MRGSAFDRWSHTVGSLVILVPLYLFALAVSFYGAVWLGVNVGGWAVLALLVTLGIGLALLAGRNRRRYRPPTG